MSKFIIAAAVAVIAASASVSAEAGDRGRYNDRNQARSSGGLLGLGLNIGGRGGLLDLDARVGGNRGGLVDLDVEVGGRDRDRGHRGRGSSGGLIDADVNVGGGRGLIDADVNVGGRDRGGRHDRHNSRRNERRGGSAVDLDLGILQGGVGGY